MNAKTNFEPFPSESRLTQTLSPQQKSAADGEKSSSLANRTQQIPSPELKTKTSPLKGRVTIYAEQQKMLKRLKRTIEKSGSFEAIDRYQLEMNQILEFFDHEHHRLDGTWFDWIQNETVSKNSEIFKRSETISAEIRRLYAQSLEKSIDLDLKLDRHQCDCVDEHCEINPIFSSRFHQETAHLWDDLRLYYATLESLMKKCLQYHALTQRLLA